MEHGAWLPSRTGAIQRASAASSKVRDAPAAQAPSPVRRLNSRRGLRRQFDVIATSDYELVTESVGLLDRSDRAKFLVRGSEAADFLQGQVSNDVEALEPGTGCYAAMLTPKARIVADMRIFRRSPEELWIDTPADALEVVLRDLRMYLRQPAPDAARLTVGAWLLDAPEGTGDPWEEA